MLQKPESEVQMQLVVDGRPINTSVPLNLVACICEDDSFRTEFLRRFENGGDGAEQFRWTFDSTKLLIEKYKYEMENFHNPLLKKHSLWAKIARQLQKEGYNVTGYMCDKKFRTLKTSYRLIKEKMRTGRTRRHWEYFKLMDDLYVNNIAIRPKTSVTAIPYPIQNICIQTSFPNFSSDVSEGRDDVSRAMFSNDSLIEGLSKISEEPTSRMEKEQPPAKQTKAQVSKQEEANKSDLDTYKIELLDIERQRLLEFRRFNDIYSRIAAALEQKNSLYQQYLDNRE